jgi:hypothetical protein
MPAECRRSFVAQTSSPPKPTINESRTADPGAILPRTFPYGDLDAGESKWLSGKVHDKKLPTESRHGDYHQSKKAEARNWKYHVRFTRDLMQTPI